MGFTRKQCEAWGIGDLFPSGKRGRRGPAHERFKMNCTEARFAEHLEARKLAGEIEAWSFEMDTLVLSPDMTYTPDFRVEAAGGRVEWVDVKRAKCDGGWTHEDSVVKAKAAAALFPWHRFYLATWYAPRGTRPGRWAIRQLGVAPKRKGEG